MPRFIFGVFTQGKLLFPIGKPINCSHKYAEIIVGILDLAKYSLLPGCYFACDYVDNIKGFKGGE